MDKYLNSIIEGNCVEVMKSFDENSIDLTVTSPPYDNLRTYKGYVFPFEEIAEQLYRVTKPGGIVVWVVADATIKGSETGTSFKQALHFKEKRYNNIFEYIFVFSKGEVKTHNAIKIDCLHAGLRLNGTTYKSYSKGEQKREKMAKPVKKKKIKGNIWEYVVGKKAEDQEAKGHPAPFPCALARDHINSWTNKGDIVLDPMNGSGTTCVSALQLNRQYIGIDMSREYCEIARERIARFESQSRLFMEEDEPYMKEK